MLLSWETHVKIKYLTCGSNEVRYAASVKLAKKKEMHTERSLRPSPATTILDQQQVISGYRSKAGQNVGPVG